MNNAMDHQESPGSGTGAASVDILVATSNRGKLAEIQSILSDRPWRYCLLDSFPHIQLPEEGEEYEPNVIEKARFAAAGSGLISIADDSGLEVEALDWGPGPLSARFGGDGLSDAQRVAKLLDALKDCPQGQRRARFVCYAAVATPEGEVWTTRGECTGVILAEPRGEGGFGYDPVFLPDDGPTEAGGAPSRSMGELPPSVKNRISHRAHAFIALSEKLDGLASAFVSR